MSDFSNYSFSSFSTIRELYLPKIDAALAEVLSSNGQGNDITSEMTSYHLDTGGKRLRALIPIQIFAACGADPAKAVPLGVAVEMIHNATLVHDDLQDGDEMRRDRPTVWKKYSAAQAINCGDAMFQFAFRLLAKLDIDSACLIRLFDRAAAATIKVIEGQAQEFLMKEERCPGVSRYIGVIRGKTSGLFALPIVGAMEALGLSAAANACVEDAAMDLGMLFQIQDDLLDIYGKKGRGRAATDVAEGKISMLVAHVNETGTDVDKARLDEILKKSREATTDADIAEAIAIFGRYDAKGAAIKIIRDIQQKQSADARLREVPEIRKILLELGALFLEPVNEIL